MSKVVEEWKPIKGYEGLYEVSDWGRIKSIERKVNCGYGKERKVLAKILSSWVNKDNYHLVSLHKNNIAETKTIHTLVAEAFIPNPDNKPCVEHIIPTSVGGTDNATNLKWSTYKENNNNQVTKTLQKKKKSIPVCKYTLDGVFICEYEAARDAEKDGFDHKHILEVCRGDAKKHKGFIWKLKNN